MTKERVVRYSSEELKKLDKLGEDKTDWERVKNMQDKDIIYDDDSPEITENMFDRAFSPVKTKTEVRLFLDSDVMEWYDKQKIAYKPLINTLLRSYMEAHH